jgi:hypothetical protein
MRARFPAPWRRLRRGAASAAVAVAGKLGSPALADSAREAFVQGMVGTLWTCSGMAGAGILLALAFLPSRGAIGAAQPPQSEHDVVTI